LQLVGKPRGLAFAFASGLAVCGTVWFQWSMLMFAAVVGGTWMLNLWFRRDAPQDALVATLVAGVGFAIPWWIVEYGLGANPLEWLLAAKASHEGWGSPKPGFFEAWIWWNPIDFAIYAGLPLVIAAPMALKLKPRFRGEGLAIAFTAIGILTLLGVHFSGQVQGEVARIWIPFMAPIAMGAAVTLSRAPRPMRVAVLVALLVFTLIVKNTLRFL
jgi:hypothetical protein